MTQAAEQSDDIGLESLLKVNDKGWNIKLFEETNVMSRYLCTSCGNVCDFASELDCDPEHNDNDIKLYCKSCL